MIDKYFIYNECFTQDPVLEVYQIGFTIMISKFKSEYYQNDVANVSEIRTQAQALLKPSLPIRLRYLLYTAEISGGFETPTTDHWFPLYKEGTGPVLPEADGRLSQASSCTLPINDLRSWFRIESVVSYLAWQQSLNSPFPQATMWTGLEETLVLYTGR